MKEYLPSKPVKAMQWDGSLEGLKEISEQMLVGFEYIACMPDRAVIARGDHKAVLEKNGYVVWRRGYFDTFSEDCFHQNFHPIKPEWPQSPEEQAIHPCDISEALKAYVAMGGALPPEMLGTGLVGVAMQSAPTSTARIVEETLKAREAAYQAKLRELANSAGDTEEQNHEDRSR